MFFSIILICYCLPIISISCHGTRYLNQEDCVTGYMTDRQSWVNVSGFLTVGRRQLVHAMDLSYTQNPVRRLREMINSRHGRDDFVEIKYLSLANCDLTRVPMIYQMNVGNGRSLADTVQYMTFYGNPFNSLHFHGMDYEEIFNATDAIPRSIPMSNNHEAATIWSSSLRHTVFPNLKELDLRACAIQILSPNVFSGMKNLEALYLSDNDIYQIDAAAFVGLGNLLHLDLSRNMPRHPDGKSHNIIKESFIAFTSLVNLESLDFSQTPLTQSYEATTMIMRLKKLKLLSLCNTGLDRLPEHSFFGIPLEILDVSNNPHILANKNVLFGLENRLRILFASGTGLQSMEMFKYFRRLEILRLSKNEISHVPVEVVSTLRNLQILDLNNNRLTNWMNRTFSVMPKLRLLSLRENMINLISRSMVEDIQNIEYIAMANNFIVCYCEAKEFFEMAANNEYKFNDTKIKEIAPRDSLHHEGYSYYNQMIFDRIPIMYTGETEIEDSGKFRLIDYDRTAFTCLVVPDGTTVSFFELSNCSGRQRDVPQIEDGLIKSKRMLLLLLIIPGILIPSLFCMSIRHHLKFFFITMRNSAMLSLINKNKMVDDGTIYNYDVFVSYCNEDRGWVLDHLLPHIEADCSISACLHERDFQVGLSILENIVSCMDRSRYIMLVLSQRFLISRWCQFEMHLAQHRLIETRREDLILVLLEDIPRRVRPNTLHYLMLTKTYIVWPKEESDREVFWKRMKKSLVSEKNKLTQNVSLA